MVSDRIQRQIALHMDNIEDNMRPIRAYCNTPSSMAVQY